MRRHAKASSAGSTQGQGSRPGSFIRGANATRGYSSDADGSSAPARRGRLVTFSLAAALLALALFASSAFASNQVVGSFGSPAESGSLGGELNNPRDVAVNGTGVGPANAGDTYVADEANNRIERFDSAGNFVSAWGKDTIAAEVNERQRIVLEAQDPSTTYTLSFNGSTTIPIQFNFPPPPMSDNYSAACRASGVKKTLRFRAKGPSPTPTSSPSRAPSAALTSRR